MVTWPSSKFALGKERSIHRRNETFRYLKWVHVTLVGHPEAQWKAVCHRYAARDQDCCVT